MPSVVDRAAQRYVAERATLGIAEFPRIADRLPAIIGTLAAAGVHPAGPPFFRYRVIHPGMRFTVEACVPVDAEYSPAEPMFTDVLPAGRYALSTYVGAPDGLVGAATELLDWAAGEGLKWDRTEAEDGEHWGARVEVLNTDPRQTPNPADWVTDLLFRLDG